MAKSRNNSALPPSPNRDDLQTLFAAPDAETLIDCALRLQDGAVGAVAPGLKGGGALGDSVGLMVARSLYGLAHDALETSTDGDKGDVDSAIQKVRLRKGRATCLRDMGLLEPARRELVAVIDQQAALRDPDQSETWIILTNLYLSTNKIDAAVAAARQAVHVVERDGFPARVRERLAQSQIFDCGSEAAQVVALRFHREAGHRYAQTSDVMADRALSQLAQATERHIRASRHFTPAQVEARRDEVLQLSANLLGAHHAATLHRAAEFAEQNAQMYMERQDWALAAAQMEFAVTVGTAAHLDDEVLSSFEARHAACVANARGRCGPRGGPQQES